MAAVDNFLTEPARIVLIGGSAAALGYGVETVTRDVDAFEGDRDQIQAAAKMARAATGIDIPIDFPGVADLPYNYEERLHRVLESLGKLRVFVVEKHDLVLSKIVRGTDHDMEQIEALNDKRGSNTRSSSTATWTRCSTRSLTLGRWT